jgi:hypothetical protein
MGMQFALGGLRYREKHRTKNTDKKKCMQSNMNIISPFTRQSQSAMVGYHIYTKPRNSFGFGWFFGS